ncbi:MerC domain-containing protein [Colwellia sp. UCD-KL20]|uniref:MerC domain-containing protein n=1 Tax=Colwellia sp. UCD-KL20 TaxID=1917165 RepID=UPI00097062B1|nr:MerC domain-containing protein [Colwellia sp. UCD-KL20]
MIKTQPLIDKLAISISIACAIHCLVMPIVLLLLPAFAVLPLNNEAFHLWMVIIIIPTSIYALFMGCKQHKRFRLLLIGAIGLVFLTSALLIGDEVWEKVLTLLGSFTIASGHFVNYRLCQKSNNCNTCED